MITIKVDGVEGVMSMLTDVERRQLPFATSLALNKTAQEVREETRREMQRVFRRPVPYVLNSMEIVPARKTNLRAVVRPKAQAGYFAEPQVEGLPRRRKGSEKLLTQFRHMRSGQWWVPGKGARYNAAGNIQPGQIVQMLSVLKALNDPRQGQTMRSIAVNKKPRDYFVLPQVSQGLLPGVYERVARGGRSLGRSKVSGRAIQRGMRGDAIYARGIRPVLIFTGQQRYRARLPFYDVGKKVVSRVFREKFFSAMSRAMATSR